jgi:hypothetical protein
MPRTFYLSSASLGTPTPNSGGSTLALYTFLSQQILLFYLFSLFVKIILQLRGTRTWLSVLHKSPIPLVGIIKESTVKSPYCGNHIEIETCSHRIRFAPDTAVCVSPAWPSDTWVGSIQIIPCLHLQSPNLTLNGLGTSYLSHTLAYLEILKEILLLFQATKLWNYLLPSMT